MSGRRETYGRPGLEEKWAAGTRSPAKGRPFDLLVHIERAATETDSDSSSYEWKRRGF